MIEAYNIVTRVVIVSPLKISKNVLPAHFISIRLY